MKTGPLWRLYCRLQDIIFRGMLQHKAPLLSDLFTERVTCASSVRSLAMCTIFCVFPGKIHIRYVAAVAAEWRRLAACFACVLVRYFIMERWGSCVLRRYRFYAVENCIDLMRINEGKQRKRALYPLRQASWWNMKYFSRFTAVRGELKTTGRNTTDLDAVLKAALKKKVTV